MNSNKEETMSSMQALGNENMNNEDSNYAEPISFDEENSNPGAGDEEPDTEGENYQPPLGVGDVGDIIVTAPNDRDYVDPISKTNDGKRNNRKRKRVNAPVGSEKRLALSSEDSATPCPVNAGSFGMSSYTDDEEIDYRVTFNQPQAFKNALDIISKLVNVAEFSIFKSNNDEKSYISHTGMDDSRICLITMKLVCEVDIIDSEEPDNDSEKLFTERKFCIIAPEVAQAIKRSSNKAPMVLYKKKNQYDNNITIEVYDPLSKEHRELEIAEVGITDPFEGTIANMEHDFTLELSLPSLKTMIDDTIKAKANDIYFEIFEPKEDIAKNLTAKHTFFRLRFEGQTVKNNSRTFHSVSELNSGVVIFKTDENTALLDDVRFQPKDLELKYQDAFSAKNLSNFFKYMDKSIVTIKLSPENPMIIEYSLWLDSFVRLCCIPKSKDNDEMMNSCYDEQPIAAGEEHDN